MCIYIYIYIYIYTTLICEYMPLLAPEGPPQRGAAARAAPRRLIITITISITINTKGRLYSG